MSADRLRNVRLDGETDLAGFRTAARALLLLDVPPDAVAWSTREGPTLGGGRDAAAQTPAQLAAEAAVVDAPSPRVPAAFVELCTSVALHADAGRHALLYRLLWRLVHEPALRHDALDADRLRAERMAREVSRPATQPARKRPQLAQLKVQPSRAAAAKGAEGRPTPAAEGHATLDALRVATDRCRECPIGEHATQSVFGEGPAGAKLMLVGEQPGDQEDLRGRPFVGPAGQLLDRAMAELGWPRETLYVTNAVKHFKFELRGKRRLHKTPTQREAAACAHWLEAEIERVQPQALVALGATAARSLLGRQVGVLSERGQWLRERSDGRPVLVTLHPSALLRMQPEERDAAYAHWLEDLARASAQAKARG